MYSIIYAYVCVIYIGYVCLYISEMNGYNDMRARRKELGLFCYFKVLILPMKWYPII